METEASISFLVTPLMFRFPFSSFLMKFVKAVLWRVLNTVPTLQNNCHKELSNPRGEMQTRSTHRRTVRPTLQLHNASNIKMELHAKKKKCMQAVAKWIGYFLHILKQYKQVCWDIPSSALFFLWRKELQSHTFHYLEGPFTSAEQLGGDPDLQLPLQTNASSAQNMVCFLDIKAKTGYLKEEYPKGAHN